MEDIKDILKDYYEDLCLSLSGEEQWTDMYQEQEEENEKGKRRKQKKKKKRILNREE